MYTISSELRQVSVNPLGAELTSLVSVPTDEEFMWSGDAAIWSGRAPILFPIVGQLRHGQMNAKGQSWLMNRHGFVRSHHFHCQKQAENQLICTFESDDKTLLSYPWRFRLTVSYTLIARELLIDYRVENLDKETLLFNLGSHPAFSLPLAGAQIADYQIRFDQAESLQLHKLRDNLLQRTTEPFQLDQNTLRITPSLFDSDALVFMNIQSRELTLQHCPPGCIAPVSRVVVNTGGAPHLGIWAKPAAPYVCIEPWWGYADFADASGEFSEKSSVQSLAVGETFEHRLTITTIDRE
ncbi:MAG: galactose mutarotase-like enzyme [Porticoccaceae bacterium]|jgi:galactose mutarotase-like enzyme